MTITPLVQIFSPQMIFFHVMHVSESILLYGYQNKSSPKGLFRQ